MVRTSTSTRSGWPSGSRCSSSAVPRSRARCASRPPRSSRAPTCSCCTRPTAARSTATSARTSRATSRAAAGSWRCTTRSSATTRSGGASVLGGAWENGKAKWHEGTTDLYFTDREHPVSAGISNFRFEDEIYTDLDMLPQARVLVRGFQSVFDASPQAWVYEKDPYRAFVAIQGHEWSSFAHPAWRTLVLRGIAWAGKRDAELLTSKEERAQLRYPPGGPLAPEKAAAAIDVHPDFNLSLVAAEPLIVKPISIDWDARGRMWVAETPGYPEKERFSGVPAHDEISILSDSNGDGRMDKKQVFFHGLDLVTSLVFHKDGVIVSQAPDILWLRDTDGDDVADKKEVLFTGFGFGDTHAVISNLRWGLDGWIYGTQGYSGNDSRHVTNAAGKDFGHIGNGLFRFKPDGSAIEMVSNYGSNTWGCDFDDEGELFFSMANGAHLRHVVVPERVFAGGRMGQVESWADCPDHDKVVPLLDAQRSGLRADRLRRRLHRGLGLHALHRRRLAGQGVGQRALRGRADRAPRAPRRARGGGRHVQGHQGARGRVHRREGPLVPARCTCARAPTARCTCSTSTTRPSCTTTRAAPSTGRRTSPSARTATTCTAASGACSTSARRSSSCATSSKASDERARAGARVAERLDAHERRAPDRRARASRSRWPTRSSRNRATRASPRNGRARAWRASTRRPGSSRPATRTRRCSAAAARIACEFAPASAAGAAQLVGFVHERDARLRLLALLALGELPALDEAVDAVIKDWDSLRDPWSRNAALRVAAKAPKRALERITAGGMGTAEGLLGELARRAARAQSGPACAAIVALVGNPNAVRAQAQLEVLDVLARDLPVEAAPPITPELKKSLLSMFGSGSIEVASAALRLALRWDKQGALQSEIERLADHMAQMLKDTRLKLPTRTAALSTLLLLPERRALALEGATSLLDAGATLEDGLALIDGARARRRSRRGARPGRGLPRAERQAAGRDLREARRACELVGRAARPGRVQGHRRALARRAEAAPAAQLARRGGGAARAEALHRRRRELGPDRRLDRAAAARGRPARRRGERQEALRRELRRLPHRQRRGRQDRSRHHRHGRARRARDAGHHPRPQPHGRPGLRRVEPDDQGRPALRRRAGARGRRLGAAALERRRAGGRARGDRGLAQHGSLADARGLREARRRRTARRDRLPRAGHGGLPHPAAGRLVLAQLAQRTLRPPPLQRGAQTQALRHQHGLRRALRGARPGAHAEQLERDRAQGRHGVGLGLQEDRPDARRSAGRLRGAAGARAGRHRRLGLSLPSRADRDPQVDLEVPGRLERGGRAAQRRRVRRLDRAQRRARVDLRRRLPGRRQLGPAALPLARAVEATARGLDRARELRQPVRAHDHGPDGRAAGRQAHRAREAQAAHAGRARRAARRRRLEPRLRQVVRRARPRDARRRPASRRPTTPRTPRRSCRSSC